jgi:hypothetical protein
MSFIAWIGGRREVWDHLPEVATSHPKEFLHTTAFSGNNLSATLMGARAFLRQGGFAHRRFQVQIVAKSFSTACRTIVLHRRAYKGTAVDALLLGFRLSSRINLKNEGMAILPFSATLILQHRHLFLRFLIDGNHPSP